MSNQCTNSNETELYMHHTTKGGPLVSMDRCASCSRVVDTDYALDCYDEIGACLCPDCRWVTNESDVKQPDGAK